MNEMVYGIEYLYDLFDKFKNKMKYYLKEIGKEIQWNSNLSRHS